MKGILGLAVRARQSAAGMDACRMLIRSGQCGVLLLDGGTGMNTRKKAAEICSKAGVPIADLPGGMIEEATGKCNMVLGICKGGFSEQIREILAEDRTE